MGIKRLEIAGFKSIDGIELTDLPNYCVFAGANGAGKSNFFDALRFASAVIDVGAVKAIRQFQGYERIHCVKRRKDKARTFCFKCDIGLKKTSIDYLLDVYQMDRDPVLVEQLTVGSPTKSKKLFIRDRDGTVRLNDEEQVRFSTGYSMITRGGGGPGLTHHIGEIGVS